MNRFITIATVLILTPNPISTLYLKCVDSENSDLLTTIWKSNIEARRPANGSYWYYEGSDSKEGTEFWLKYEREVGGRLDNLNVKLYLEYWNDSPRRIVLEGASEGRTGGSSGHVMFLDGDSSLRGNWWLERFYSVVGGEWRLKLTSIMKKPQRLYLRKLVLIQDPSNPRNRDVSLTDILKSMSCEDMNRDFGDDSKKPSSGGVSSSSSYRRGASSLTIRPSTKKPVVLETSTGRASVDENTESSSSSSAKPELPSFFGGSTKTTVTSRGGCGSDEPPECKCVCDCSCKDRCVGGGGRSSE